MKSMFEKAGAWVTAIWVALIAAFALLSAPAHAEAQAAIVVTDVVTGISNQLVPISLIALAVLGIFIALKSWKWVRRALS